MNKLTKISREAIPLLALCTLTTISTLSSGCATRLKLIPADQAETFVKGGAPFTPANDGVYMNDARYQRYRRAVADEIEKAGGK
jgi:hypothetical protein